MSRLESLLFAAVVFLLVGVVGIILVITEPGVNPSASPKPAPPTVSAPTEALAPGGRVRIPVRKTMDAKPDEKRIELGLIDAEIADAQPTEFSGGEVSPP